MDRKEQKRRIDGVLGQKGDLMMSTSDKQGNMRVAMMSYARVSDSELLFTTEKTAGKVKNLRENPQVGMIRFDADSKQSLLIYGDAEILPKSEVQSSYEEMMKIAPEYKAFTNMDRLFFRIKIRRVIYEWYHSPDGEEYYFEINEP